MKKKALLASAIALVTASAMTFAPVSYKVIDKAHAAPVVSEEKQQAAQTLQGIFAQLNSTTLVKDDVEVYVLKDAYTAMLAEVTEDIALLDLESDFEILHTNLGANSTAVENALKSFVGQLVADYSADSINLGDISTGLEGEIAALNGVLSTVLDTTVAITTDDVAKLLVAVEEEALTGSINLTNIDVVDEAIGLVVDYAEAQWAAPSNEVVSVLKALYNDELEDLKSDIADFKEKRKTLLDADLDKKKAYKNGAAALAISYAKYKLEGDNRVSIDSRSGKKFTLHVNTNGITVPLSLFDWSSTEGTFDVDALTNDGELILNLSGVNLSQAKTVEITAKLAEQGEGIPAEFKGIEIFKQDLTIPAVNDTVFPGGDIIIGPELSLVSDFAAKAEAIDSKVAEYIAENPELSNNTLVYNLVQQIEAQLREALLVQSAGAVTVSNGVSTLNLTPDQLTNIYNTQLSTVLKSLEDALKEQNVDVDPAIVLTFNVGVTSNAQVNLTKAIIDSLTSNGVDTVGVKSGDVTIEAALDQLDATSKVTIQKSATTVANAKSDVYSLAITANNQDVVGFEKQYRVTLPVNGDATNVTVAQLAEGSQTLVGGKYDPATKTITFYTNVLGDFVVVENTTKFNDTEHITWANEQIQLLADKGILQGRGNGSFDPQGNVTRAEFTAMLTRALNLNASVPVTFNDVSENAWYYDAVSAARAYGIINGRSASSFDPGAQITREEMASIASNALKTILNFEAPKNADELLGSFVDDSSIASVHRANVALLANEGIVQGKGQDNFDPKGNATRAETAVIIADIFNIR